MTAVHLHAAGLLGGAAGLLGALLSHEGHGGEQSDKQGLLHILMLSLFRFQDLMVQNAPFLTLRNEANFQILQLKLKK
jgi:hypothetical protein